MNKTEAAAIIKHGQKKYIRLKEIYVDILQLLAEDFPFYEIVKKWPAESKRSRDSIDDPRSDRPKTSNTYEQIDTIHWMV